MNVTVSSEFRELIDTKIASGHYGSPSDVVQGALRLLDERDRLQDTRWKELRREIHRGLDQLDRGEGVPLDIEAIKAKARLQRR